jgi:hypothetical protein
MWGRLVVVGLALALATACESGVTVDLRITVPDEVASAYAPEAAGVLRSSEGGMQAVCGEAFDARVYSDGFGCRPDEPDVTVEAWIVPAPEAWGEICDAPGTELDGYVHPVEDLPERTEDDPSGAVDAHWKWTPICGGILEAELAIE